MPDSFPLLIVFILSALLCASTTGLWIGFARARQIHDMPGQRRLHRQTTPRGGGVGIALVVLLVLAWIAGHSAEPLPWLGLTAGVGLFAAVGLFDDLRPLPVLAKLILQLLSATLLVGFLPLMASGPNLWLLASTVLVGAFVVNVWNFMDGSNGLVAMQALLMALALAFWPGQDSAVRLAALALAGACAGFLPFNVPSARVFLGDVGSHVLGAAVFGLFIVSWRNGTLGIAQALLIGSALLLDSVLTLLRRAIAGRPLWRAHREHLYQFAVRRGHSHLRVCLFYAAWTTIAIVVAALMQESRQSAIWIALALFLIVGARLHYRFRRHWLQRSLHREVKE